MKAELTDFAELKARIDELKQQQRRRRGGEGEEEDRYYSSSDDDEEEEDDMDDDNASALQQQQEEDSMLSSLSSWIIGGAPATTTGGGAASSASWLGFSAPPLLTGASEQMSSSSSSQSSDSWWGLMPASSFLQDASSSSSSSSSWFESMWSTDTLQQRNSKSQRGWQSGWKRRAAAAAARGARGARGRKRKEVGVVGHDGKPREQGRPTLEEARFSHLRCASFAAKLVGCSSIGSTISPSGTSFHHRPATPTPQPSSVVSPVLSKETSKNRVKDLIKPRRGATEKAVDEMTKNAEVAKQQSAPAATALTTVAPLPRSAAAVPSPSSSQLVEAGEQQMKEPVAVGAAPAVLQRIVFPWSSPRETARVVGGESRETPSSTLPLPCRRPRVTRASSSSASSSSPAGKPISWAAKLPNW